MVKKIWTLALVLGLSPLAAADDVSFPENTNATDTVDLIADLIHSGEAFIPLKDMNALADDAESALEQSALDELNDLEGHIKDNMLDRLKNAFEFLSFDAEAAEEMAEQAAKLGGVESRVLLDLIRKKATEREAYIEKMINELGQAQAMLKEIVALRKSIMATIKRDREDAIDAYNEKLANS